MDIKYFVEISKMQYVSTHTLWYDVYNNNAYLYVKHTVMECLSFQRTWDKLYYNLLRNNIVVFHLLYSAPLFNDHDGNNNSYGHKIEDYFIIKYFHRKHSGARIIDDLVVCRARFSSRRISAQNHAATTQTTRHCARWTRPRPRPRPRPRIIRVKAAATRNIRNIY